MLQTKIKYENKQRAMTQNLSKQELRFMCTALPLDEIYPPTKFHNHSLLSLRDMHQKQEWQIVARYSCLTPSCKAGACTGQNSSMKNNKGQ